MTDLFDDVLLEPEPDAAEPEVDPELEPEADLSVAEEARPLVEIMPADFKIPVLTKFVPNTALRLAAEEAARYALTVKVEGAEGLRSADLALGVLRTRQAAISEHFAEPAEIANKLHRYVTGTRGEWLEPGALALKKVGDAMYREDQRLKAVEAETRRKQQDEADRAERDRLKREADAAAAAKAPEPIVQELKRQAETATAPPVSSVPARAPLKGSTSVKTYKARLIGTPAEQEPNPESKDLTPAQRLQVFELLKAILDGRAPLVAIEVAWSYLNKRAVAEPKTLAIPGVEVAEIGSTRSRPTRPVR